jgi:hypothetical protein
MNRKRKIALDEIDNQKEREVLILLKRKGKYVYGNIIKDLRLPVSKGQELIFSLISKGYIRHVDKSSFIELNVDLI